MPKLLRKAQDPADFGLFNRGLEIVKLDRTFYAPIYADEGQTMVVSNATVTSRAGLACDVLAVRHTLLTVPLKIPFAMRLSGLIMTQVAWDVTGAGPAGATGSMVFDLEDTSGNSLLDYGASLSTANFSLAAVDLNAIAGPNTNVLTGRMDKVELAEGQVVNLVWDLQIGSAVAGNVTVEIRHDPNTAGSELKVQFMV